MHPCRRRLIERQLIEQIADEPAFSAQIRLLLEVGRLDDPRLDVDDVRGYGPEIITLNRPADGIYTAAVHYCNDRISDEPTEAVLEVYVKGELVFTSQPQLMNQGDVWTALSMARTGGPQDGTWAISALAPVVSQQGTDLCNY